MPLKANKKIASQRSSTANPVTRGLVCDLDVSIASSLTLTGARVDQINDQSGNGNHFGTSAAGVTKNPTYDATLFGNKGGITFVKSTNLKLESVGAIAAVTPRTYTSIIVHKRTTMASEVTLLDVTNSVQTHSAGRANRVGYLNGYNGNGGLPLTKACVYGVTNNAGTPAYYVNGVLSPKLNSTVFTSSSAGGTFRLGDNVDMEFAHLLLYNVVLTDQEHAQIAQWLIERHNVPLQFPKYKIVCDGNSLINGYGTTSNHCIDDAMVALGYTSFDYKNFGSPGFKTTDLQSRFDSLITPEYDSKKALNVYVVWELTNHLLSGATTPTIAYNSLKALCQSAQAAGFTKIIVATCLPRDDAGLRAGFEADRLTVNTNIRTNAISEGWATHVADVGGDATIATNQASADNTTYYSDKVHLTDAGHTVCKTYFQTALSSALS